MTLTNVANLLLGRCYLCQREAIKHLDSIEVEEVWDRSGRTRNGYVEPTEMAFQMSEEALDPFIEETALIRVNLCLYPFCRSLLLVGYKINFNT